MKSLLKIAVIASISMQSMGAYAATESRAWYELVEPKTGKNHLDGIPDDQKFQDCSANAATFAIEHIAKNIWGVDIDISRIHLFVNSAIQSLTETIKNNPNPNRDNRDLLSTINYDAGVFLENVPKAITKYGLCNETNISINNHNIPGFSYVRENLPTTDNKAVIPYTCSIIGHESDLPVKIGDKTLAFNPFAKLAQNLKSQYFEATDGMSGARDFIKKVAEFIKQNQPVVIGVAMTDNFGSNSQYCITDAPPPNKITGGHAIVVTGAGYNKECGYYGLEIQNSWGPDWGQGGKAFLGEKYLNNNIIGGLGLFVPTPSATPEVSAKKS